MDKERMQDIGALWEKKTAKGDPYYTGTVSFDGVAHRVIIFKNSYKKEDKHPDFHIYPQKPKPTTDEPF